MRIAICRIRTFRFSLISVPRLKKYKVPKPSLNVCTTLITSFPFLSTYTLMTSGHKMSPPSSLIERFTAVTSSSEKDVFHNANNLFQAPGYRGIYGGATIAHSLSAAQQTVPDDFDIHTLHCLFIAPGRSADPIYYYVKRVRDGKNFISRQIEAIQKARCIFTATLSFVRDGAEGSKTLQHFVSMPLCVKAPPNMRSSRDGAVDQRYPPFESIRYPLPLSGTPAQKRERQWMRARGRLPNDAKTHQSALAYMSDSYLVGAIARVHGTKNSPSSALRSVESKMKAFPESEMEVGEMRKYLAGIGFGREVDKVDEVEEGKEIEEKSVDLVVSLNHTMYFHHPRAFRADEWMFTETEVPWTSGGRGLVMQRIWSKEGVFIVTCIQVRI